MDEANIVEENASEIVQLSHDILVSLASVFSKSIGSNAGSGTLALDSSQCVSHFLRRNLVTPRVLRLLITALGTILG